MVDGVDIRKLLRSLEHFHIKSDLTEHENKGLREAVQLEKRRRKRGKSLLDCNIAAPNKEGIFYSPAKVQIAREQLGLRETEKEQAAASKVEQKLQKQLKQQQLQERKQERELQRLEKQLQKQEALLAKQANQQLQNESRYRAKRPQKQSITVVIDIELPSTAGSDIPAAPTAPGPSRPTRQRRHPNQFQDQYE